MPAPLLGPSDVTTSGNNSALDPWAITVPAVASGDLVVVHLGWDDSTTVDTVTPPAGPNGETFTALLASPQASASTEVRVQAWWTIATGAWSAGTLSFDPSAAESRTAHVLVVPAGEFDAANPIAAAAGISSAGTAESDIALPSGNFGAAPTNGARYVGVCVADVDPITLHPDLVDWTMLATTDTGAQALAIAVADAEVTTTGRPADGEFVFRIASDSWAALSYLINGVAPAPPAADPPVARGVLSASYAPHRAAWSRRVRAAAVAALVLPWGGATPATEALEGTGSVALPAVGATGTGTPVASGSGGAAVPALGITGAGDLGAPASADAPVARGVVAPTSRYEAHRAALARRQAVYQPQLLALAQRGVETILGTGGVSLPPVGAGGTGSALVAGSGSVALPALAITGAGTDLVEGSGAVALPPPGAGGAGTPVVTASGALAIPALGITGAGDDGTPPSTEGTPVARGVVTVAARYERHRQLLAARRWAAVAQLVAARQFSAEAVEGSGALALPAIGAAGTGTSVVTAAGAATLPAVALGGAGTPVAIGSGGAAIPAVGLTGAGGDGTLSGAGALALPALGVGGAGSAVVTAVGGLALPAPSIRGTEVLFVPPFASSLIIEPRYRSAAGLSPVHRATLALTPLYRSRLVLEPDPEA